MRHYHHLSINERESLLLLHDKGQSMRAIARALGRDVSTISRELKRNATSKYSAVKAHEAYKKRRRNSKRPCLLDHPLRFETVKKLFLEQQWSPEQIAARLSLEQPELALSYNTIYRAIYARKFDEPGLSRGNRGAVRKLRHRGKRRRQWTCRGGLCSSVRFDCDAKLQTCRDDRPDRPHCFAAQSNSTDDRGGHPYTIAISGREQTRRAMRRSPLQSV